MIQTVDIQRPSRELIEQVGVFGTANIASTLYKLGIKNVLISGPVSQSSGRKIVGPALTLQFMPKRDDIYGEGEYVDPEKQLHRHALYHAQEGDIVVVDARGDMRSGIFGEMMLTYLKGRGGQGIVVDGCIRDWPSVKHLGLGVWTRGFTPNFHTQAEIMPFAVNTPVACGGALVMPGDIIVADDDGVVVVPIGIAQKLIQAVPKEYGWEDFTKEQLLKGGDLRVYYPLSEAAYPEYEDWKKSRAK
ncbi:ribonuclease activity regulator RraA [Microvirga sp. M2]|uniref:RraA family protein n=1 Tax=Microvirga sp. M2 TaxID=3073270 RepID=UPI0039C28644